MAERFQKVIGGALFLAGNKDAKSPSNEGAFSISVTPLDREAIVGVSMEVLADHPFSSATT